jgi:hypothetical protein
MRAVAQVRVVSLAVLGGLTLQKVRREVSSERGAPVGRRRTCISVDHTVDLGSLQAA